MSVAVTAGLVDPKSLPGQMALRRQATRAALYSGGVLPTALPDAVEVNWSGVTLPPGCASITRLRMDNPGGRIGTSLYAHLFNPYAPVGRCLDFSCGHAGWNDFYIQQDGSSIALRMLTHGWHVLIVDMPNYGMQPNQFTTVNGVTQTRPLNSYYVPYGVAPPFDGPPIMRLFLDYFVVSTNWILSNVCDHVYLAGVSGGGQIAMQLATIDDRFKIVHIMQGFLPSSATGFYDAGPYNDPDILGACDNDILLIAGYGYARPGTTVPGEDSVLCSACVPGRITVVHAADADEYNGDKHLQWANFISVMGGWPAANYQGASLSFYRKTTGTHSIDSTQAAWVEAHLLANG